MSLSVQCRNWLLHAVVALTVIAVVSTDRAVAAELKEVTSVEGITEYAMENGLQVLLFPDDSTPTFTVNVTYRVGSRHEGRGEAGMAHLLEHMVFKGTPTHPKIWGALQEHGARFNGTTWLDRTNYYETMPASEENLKFALRMEADRMINSSIAQSELDKEMSVVRNEFEVGENNPTAVLLQRMISSAFLWHNYGKSTIGNRSDIERVPATNLKKFYKKYYQPDNATLLVAGKFDPAQVKTLIEEYFGSIPRPRRELDKTYTEEPAQDGDRLVRLYRSGDVPVVGMVYHVPAGPHEDFAAVQVLVDLLTNHPAGRLYRGVVANGMASDIRGQVFQLAEPGLVNVTADVAKGQNPEQVLNSMIDIVERFGDSIVDEEAVKFSVARQLTSIKLAMTNSSQVGINLSESIAQGDWRLFFIHRDRLSGVTAADVKRVAAKYLIGSNRTAGIFVPTSDPKRATIPAAPNVEAIVRGYKGNAEISKGEVLEPEVGVIESRIERLEITDGIKLAILPMETRGDSVRASFHFHYGDEKSLTGKTTAEALVSQMLMRGTERLNYESLRNEIDRLESRITVRPVDGRLGGLGGEPGNVSASIQSDREHFAGAIKLLGEILKKPALDEVEFELVKSQVLSSIEQGLSDPQRLAMQELSRALRPWPKESIHYVRTLQEQLADVEDLKVDDVRDVYENLFGADHCEIAIVGDFDPSVIVPALREIFSDWKSGATYNRIVRPYRKTPVADLVINTPDKKMAMVALATAIQMCDDDKDYPAMVLSSYVLGRSANSRLMNRLRHNGGLSYSAGGGVSASAHDKLGSLTCHAICAPQNAIQAQTALKEEVMNWIASGITEQELVEAKNSYELAFKRVLRREGFLLSQMTSGLELDRTLEFRGELMEKIKALTVADIQAALARTLNGKQMVTIRAGDPTPKVVPKVGR